MSGTDHDGAHDSGFGLSLCVLKELWCFLCELYGGRNNINMAYNVIQELFWEMQNDKPMMIITASSIA